MSVSLLFGSHLSITYVKAGPMQALLHFFSLLLLLFFEQKLHFKCSKIHAIANKWRKHILKYCWIYWNSFISILNHHLFLRMVMILLTSKSIFKLTDPKMQISKSASVEKLKFCGKLQRKYWPSIRFLVLALFRIL